MEVGAVKQAYNNEVIHLKKKLNQAKIQVIHKLTRKAKTFSEKKGPENIIEKFKKKATSAVNEVLLIKKITNKDIAKFAVSHSGELQDFLNKQNVDKEKAYARLLLHKTMHDKYTFLRSTFSNMPIEDLLMSREERKKLKKEQKEKQMNKKNKRKSTTSISSEGDWNIENVKVEDAVPSLTTGDKKEFEVDSDTQIESNKNVKEELNCGGESTINSDVSVDGSDSELSNIDLNENDNEIEKLDDIIKGKNIEKETINRFVPKLPENPPKLEVKEKNISIKKKSKEVNKNRNLNDKIQAKKFKKDLSTTEEIVQDNKIVDPFFMTSTGENYMSVVEPRPPDEVKEIHNTGNRKIRRAAMFGHELKFKPRKNNNFDSSKRFRNEKVDHTRPNKWNSNNKYGSSSQNSFKSKTKFEGSDNVKQNYRNEKSQDSFHKDEVKKSEPEKLHPSWEAKKKISSILPFQGKKTVFE